jgi:hypothetical protein
VEDVAEEPQELTVLARLTRAGLSADRVQWWLAQEGGVWVDGEPSPTRPRRRRRHRAVVLRS